MCSPRNGARDGTCDGVSLIFTGVCYVLLGAVMGFMLGPIMGLEQRPGAPPMPDAFLTVMGVVMFVMCAGFGAANFVAAWGLARGAKWAWFVTVIVGGIYAPSGCLPFGVVLLYGMLNERTRKTFLG